MVMWLKAANFDLLAVRRGGDVETLMTPEGVD